MKKLISFFVAASLVLACSATFAQDLGTAPKEEGKKEDPASPVEPGCCNAKVSKAETACLAAGGAYAKGKCTGLPAGQTLCGNVVRTESECLQRSLGGMRRDLRDLKRNDKAQDARLDDLDARLSKVVTRKEFDDLKAEFKRELAFLAQGQGWMLDDYVGPIVDDETGERDESKGQRSKIAGADEKADKALVIGTRAEAKADDGLLNSAFVSLNLGFAYLTQADARNGDEMLRGGNGFGPAVGLRAGFMMPSLRLAIFGEGLPVLMDDADGDSNAFAIGAEASLVAAPDIAFGVFVGYYTENSNALPTGSDVTEAGLALGGQVELTLYSSGRVHHSVLVRAGVRTGQYGAVIEGDPGLDRSTGFYGSLSYALTLGAHSAH